MMRSRRRQASRRVGLAFKVVIPVFGAGHGHASEGWTDRVRPTLGVARSVLVVNRRDEEGRRWSDTSEGFRAPNFGGRDYVEQCGSSDSDLQASSFKCRGNPSLAGGQSRHLELLMIALAVLGNTRGDK
jgi:hypothetical protein